MNIPASVEIYKQECAAILSWLSDEWLHQDEFDRRSFAFRHDRTRKVEIHSFTPETIVPPMNGDLNVAILQEFQRAGLVEARERDGKVEYRLAP